MSKSSLHSSQHAIDAGLDKLFKRQMNGDAVGELSDPVMEDSAVEDPVKTLLWMRCSAKLMYRRLRSSPRNPE